MADVSQAPAGQDQSRSGCSSDEKDFRGFLPEVGKDVAPTATSIGSRDGSKQ
jgi:hypothetical protein